MEVLLEAGLEDLEADDESYFNVVVDVKDLETAKQALDDAGIAYENAKMDMIPDNFVEPEPDEAVKAMKLVDALENCDDVQAVYSNLEISEQAMNSLDS